MKRPFINHDDESTIIQCLAKSGMVKQGQTKFPNHTGEVYFNITIVLNYTVFAKYTLMSNNLSKTTETASCKSGR